MVTDPSRILTHTLTGLSDKTAQCSTTFRTRITKLDLIADDLTRILPHLLTGLVVYTNGFSTTFHTKITKAGLIAGDPTLRLVALGYIVSVGLSQGPDVYGTCIHGIMQP